MAEYIIQEETLINLADAIRGVSSESATMSPDEMTEYITNYLVKPTATKAAATITPSTSNQTIASGTYLTGTQTIKGDSNLKAANIKSGTSIFGVSGSLTDMASNMANFYGFTKAKSGSFTTPASNQTTYTITHNLGSIPRFIMYSSPYVSHNTGLAWGGILFTTNGVSSFKTKTASGDYGIAVRLYYYTNQKNLGAAGYGVNSTYAESSIDPMSNNIQLGNGGIIYNPTSTTFSIPSGSYSGDIKLGNATTYDWLVMA